MKIEVNTRGSREYYDEFLYIVPRYKKYQKNLKKKTHRLTYYLTAYEILAFIVGALNAYFYYLNGNVIHLVMTCMLGLMLIIYLRYHLAVGKQIKTYLNEKGNKEIEINEEYVGFRDDSKDIRLKWDELSGIVMGKYGLCFLPKDQTGILISVSREYEDEVRKGLHEVGREYLMTESRK